MGASSRRKGNVGQSTFANMLRARDWIVDEIKCGIAREDLVCTNPDGVKYSVEVKNCASITSGHKRQAMEQATRRKLDWMLANKISGTSSWLVQRKHHAPKVWHERGEDGAA